MNISAYQPRWHRKKVKVNIDDEVSRWVGTETIVLIFLSTRIEQSVEWDALIRNFRPLVGFVSRDEKVLKFFCNKYCKKLMERVQTADVPYISSWRRTPVSKVMRLQSQTQDAEEAKSPATDPRSRQQSRQRCLHRELFWSGYHIPEALQRHLRKCCVWPGRERWRLNIDFRQL